MDYQQLLLTLLPDLLVVVALFAALGVDYERLRGSRVAKRYEVAFQSSAAGLIAGLADTGSPSSFFAMTANVSLGRMTVVTPRSETK